MLQIGRFLCRGQGAMLVTGPLGAALVPLDFADSAADVVWGRADTQAWLSHVQAERGDVLLLDCAGEQPYLTVLGNIQLRMRAAGQITEQVWTDPIWAWPFNPGEWQTFEATIIEGDEVTWMVPAADRVEAAEIRIGRALDEVEALASMPVDTMGFLINPDIPDHERRARREAREELPEPSLHTSSVDLAAVEAQFLAATSNGPVSLTPSTRAATHSGDEAAKAPAETLTEEAPEPVEETTERDAEQPSGELYVVADAEEPPVDTAESAERAGGFGESGAPASSEAEKQPAAEPEPEMAPEPPAAPEAMSAEGLADLGAETDTEATILRLAPVNSGPAAPVAFLIHGGTVPVEVSRDVVIGRDPDARALTGRPVATVLRVPSPATEISRSHCAVMMTTPGSWALMDLGSANGTVLRHADGSFQDVTPMVTIALNDGDLIDVGEGTTIEFRVR
ncbi:MULTISPECIES: FHA domain-containing protein [Actinomycetaceae]|uniref:FHA domain-containing protein n=1 Tax=Actinomycetaceae TaxID=2049 RepID=UPI000397EDDB|nr:MULTISPECIES: FHA domain-containing protein [Actinomycetaceae]ERH29301.1 FHA domain protein [Actinomyces sp. oral taxon 172 str. F0311]WLD78328.1 FHA domain-containing protein [Schaalia sp. HMT-172]